ncbi:MAG: Asp-tRNA(Asn)/Glu-tRNA(Gln) amidotransferase GatCAB subunit B, partial [Planctomycetes bacterium]|nr:Asp-tRNA(Asn)/Glu-tRNA(Gln) amidotransferase GatCAB subunit B [Planctomycetota bacterium]
RPIGSTELGDKVEIKNLNSFKMVQRALEYEQRRQAAILSAGGHVTQETRLWNDEKGETASMRSKEDAHDYRYFPEPDLPPLYVEQALIDEIQRSMPELPDARRARYRDEFGLPEYDIGVLTADHALGEYFEQLTAHAGDPKESSNWVTNEVQRALNESHTTISDFAIPAMELGALIAMQIADKVSRQAAKKVFQHMLDEGVSATDAIAALGLEQISDESALREIAQQVIADNDRPVADYRAGKTKALHALKGLCMKATRGKANPQVVERLLLELLDG